MDEDKEFSEQIAAELRKVGLTPVLAGEGKAGLDLAKQSVPAAFVVSVELPRMSGYSVCTKIRKDEQLKAVPVIITSKNATPETFESHSKLSTRADEYIKKPFPAAQLIDALRPHIGQYMEEAAEDVGVLEDAVVADEEEVFADDEPLEMPPEADHTSDDAVSALRASVRLSTPATASVGEDDPEALTHAGKLESAKAARAASQIASGPSASELAARRQADSLRLELDRSQSALEEAQKERDEAIAALEQLRSSQVPVHAPAGRELLDLKKQLNQKEKDLHALKQQLTEKEGAALEWADKETELEERIATLEEEKARVEGAKSAGEAKAATEARTAASTIADLKRRLGEASTREADLDGTVQSLQRDLDATRESLEEKTSSEASLKQRLAGTEQKLGAAEAKGKELEGALERQKADNAKLTEDRDAKKRELEQRTGELAERTEERDELHAQLEVTRSEAERLGAESARLSNELGAATAEANGLRDQLKQANDEIEALRAQIIELESVLQGEMSEKDAVKAQLEETQAERERTEGHLNAAYQRVREDEAIRSKALQALEIAVALLKEAGYSATAASAGEGEGVTGATRAQV